VLDILLQHLKKISHERNTKGISVIDHFRYGMFSLLALMCFGDKLDENQIREIEESQRIMFLNFSIYNVLDFWSPITKILYWNRWKEFLKLRSDQNAVLIPYINARRKIKERFRTDGENNVNESHDEFVLS
jgi:cytochrome P450 family 89 subfamily A